jgi:hypothetical protein
VASSLVSSQLAKLNSRPISRAHTTQSLLGLWHLGSLDAPTVSVVWTLAIARSVGVHVELGILILIGCGTWTVYVLDRLLDARRAIHAQTLWVLRERHYFHWRHRRILLPLAACSTAVAAVLIYRCIPATAREHDSVIAAAALAYFSGVHVPASLPQWARRIVTKELLVGVLFTAGCAAPTLSHLRSIPFVWPLVLTLSFLALLAWTNCAAIERWESQGTCPDMTLFALLLGLSGFAMAALLAREFAAASVLLILGGVSAMLLFGLHRVRRRLNPVDLRALADFVLLLPALLLIPGALRG